MVVTMTLTINFAQPYLLSELTIQNDPFLRDMVVIEYQTSNVRLLIVARHRHNVVLLAYTIIVKSEPIITHTTPIYVWCCTIVATTLIYSGGEGCAILVQNH